MMNERIKDLAEQAGFCHDVNNGIYLCAPMHMEKFAELIVAECIQVGGPEDSYTDEWFKAKADSVAKIKKHFGVE